MPAAQGMVSRMSSSEERRAEREARRTVESAHAESRLMAGMIRALGGDLYAVEKHREPKKADAPSAQDDNEDHDRR
jgi:hypothetical protein